MTMLFLGLMLSGTLALGLSDALRKKYLTIGMHEQAFLTITLFFTGILLLPVLIVIGVPEIKEGFWFATTITILLNLISQNLFIRAFNLSEASLIAPLRLIIPPIVIVTGFIFLDERPSVFGILGIFITMLGLWVLLQGGEGDPQSLHGLVKNKGVKYGLVGSILFAASFPFDKLSVVKSSAVFSTTIIFTTLGVLTYLINLARNKHFTHTVTETFRLFFKENLLISVSSSIGVLLTNQALNYSLVAYAASLKRLQALWTVIIAGKLLKEKEKIRRIVATIIMLAGILLSVLWK